MTRISHILNFGEWQSVVFNCGHRRRVRKANIREEQLYIGKAVTCGEYLDNWAAKQVLEERRKTK